MSARTTARIQPDSSTLALWQIAETGDVQQLKRVLASGADVNASNESGVTALMIAAFHGRFEMVRALADHGADLNAMDHDGFTAAMLAEHSGHEDIVRILLARREKKIFKPDVSNPSSPRSKVDGTFDDLSGFDVTPRGSNPKVRTLHDPPEIWDLVHETRQEFAPGSTFVGHFTSINHLMLIVIALIVVGVAVFGLMKLRGRSASDQAASTASLPASVPAPSTNGAAATTPSASHPPQTTSLSVKAPMPNYDDNRPTATGSPPSEPKPTTLSSNRKAASTSEVVGSRVDSKITGVAAASVPVPSGATPSVPGKRVVAKRSRENPTSSTAANSGARRHDEDNTQPSTAAPTEAAGEKAVNPTTAKKVEDKASPQLNAPAKASPTPKARVIPWP